MSTRPPKTILLPLRSDYNAQIGLVRKEFLGKGKGVVFDEPVFGEPGSGAWIEVRAFDATAGHPTGYMLLFRPRGDIASRFVDTWRIVSSNMMPLRDDEAKILARIAEDWVKKRRVITSEDIRVARFAFAKKWREVLSSEFENREALLRDARRRIEESGMKLPNVRIATRKQTIQMEHAVAEAVLALHTGDGVTNWPTMRRLLEDLHYSWSDVQIGAARRAEALVRIKALHNFPIGEVDQDAAAIVRDLIKMDAERGDGFGPLDGIGSSSSGIVMAAGMFLGGVLLGRRRP